MAARKLIANKGPTVIQFYAWEQRRKDELSIFVSICTQYFKTDFNPDSYL